MKISSHYIALARRLSCVTSSPQRAFLVMRQAMQDTLRLLKAISVLDMFIVLVRRDLVLTTVRHQCASMCRGLQGDKEATLARMIMKWKMADAKRVVKERKYLHTCDLEREILAFRTFRVNQSPHGLFNVHQKDSEILAELRMVKQSNFL